MDDGLPFRGAALVTGGAKGIGLAIVEQLVGAGVPTAILDIDERSVASVSARLGQRKAPVVGLVGNAAEESDVEAAFGEAETKLGALRMLVSNAGVTAFGAADAIAVDAFDQATAVNLRGTFLALRAAIPRMRSAGGGAIVVVASNAGLVARAEDPAYCATKAAAIMLARSVALSVASDRIRVNVVCPGPVDTPLYRASLPPGEPAEATRRVLASVPLGRALGRVAAAHEVADLCCYLLSERAAYITGAAIPIDGGKTAGLQVVLDSNQRPRD